MMRKTNHEGYYDPTACDAIIRADKGRKRQQRTRNIVTGLTYCLWELPCFWVAVNALRE